MKTLLTSVFTLLLSLSVNAGIPYLITPTNAPGVLGQSLFTAGNGYSWWDWGTNAAGSNSTVVSASTTISIQTNGFNFTPVLSPTSTNWILSMHTNTTLYLSTANGMVNVFNSAGTLLFAVSNNVVQANTNILAAGGISSPGTGASSEHFGLLSQSPGTQSQAFGNNSIAQGLQSLAAGYLSRAYSNFTVAAGVGAVAQGNSGTAVGSDAHAYSNNAVALGENTVASGSNSLAVGPYANATHFSSTAIGARSATTADLQIMMGTESNQVVFPGTVLGLGDGWTNGSGYHFADTNLVTVSSNGIISLTIANNLGKGTNTTFYLSTANGMVNFYNSAGTLLFGVSNNVVIANTNILANGGISSPGTGLSSERFGLSSQASGLQAQAFGNSAIAQGVQSAAVGYLSRAYSNATVAVGVGAVAQGNSGTAVGSDAHAYSNNTVAIGLISTASGSNATALGPYATASHFNSTAIGQNAQSTAANQVMLGTATDSVTVLGSLITPNFNNPTNTPTDGYVLTAAGTAGFSRWSAAAAGSGTGIQTNGGSGTNNIFTSPTMVGSGGSSNTMYIVYGTTPTLQARTNGDLFITGTLNSTNFIGPTNAPTDTYVLTATGTEGFTKWATAAAGSGTGIQTNNGTGTNNAFTTAKFLSVPGVQLANVTDSQVTIQTNFQMSSVGGAKMQRVYGGTTNGFMSVINARDYGLVSSGGDQTANLQAAITAATNSGLFSVYIPASTNVYTINGLIIPAGVRLFGDSPKGVIGTGQGSTLYGNAQGKPMLIPSGQNIEIEHIGLLNDGGGDGSVGILITNESSLLQDFSVHDVTIKGFFIGMKMHYTWGGKIANNQIINCGYGIDASNNVNAMHFSHNYFANTNSVWLHGDSNYKNTFDGVNEFEAYPEAAFVSSNGVMMAGINQSTTFSDNYFEKITNGIVVNGSYKTIIRDNVFINGQNGTNVIIVGAEAPSVIGNRAVDQYPFIHVDGTTYGMTYKANDVRSGASVTLNPITMDSNDGTNTVATGGSYYGPSINGGGLSRLADTNWVIAQFSSLGGLVYSSGVTNALVMTNNAAGENGYRTNIWQGQVSVPTVITTNTINMVSATAGTYVRHYVSTNKYVTIGAGPVNVVSYLFRSGAAGTVSGHYEIYAVDSVSGQMTELTSSTTHTIAETVPTLHQFTMSVPTDYTPANQAYIAVAFKLDTVVNGQTFNFVSGSNYDGHISFSRPLSSATITMSQVAGLAAALTDTTNNVIAATNETTLRAYATNLDNTILTPATATNTMPLFGGFFRLVISTPAAITNLTGVTAGEYRYSTLVLSNSLGTTLTNYLLINAIPMGYAATNSVAVLGKNAYVVPAGKQVRLLLDCEGINQTNWAIISQ